MRVRRPLVTTILAACAAALVLAGCGLAPRSNGTAVSLTITRGFGSRQVSRPVTRPLSGSETVIRALARSYRISTTSGGAAVQSISGQSSATAGGDWSYFVNGVLDPGTPASTHVHAGDHIWWDLHPTTATLTIRAVVGSYPEPFVNGISGKRYPVTVECAPSVTAACNTVTSALQKVHVPAAPQLLGTGSGPDTLGVVVGTWREIRSEVAAELIAYGPGASGVYARFTGTGGTRLQLLDGAGRVVRSLGAGAGLVAATADTSSVPTWMITGTDGAGVAAAARALTPQALRNHFALAVQGAQRFPVPLQSPG